FTYEGLFRQHMIVKDRNRDTTWFSMLDTEWSRIKENMEEWLYHNPDKSWSLREKNQGLGGAR
ncbi:MAG: GNAT family N-acetyltransferase, partial [Gemmatimonadota bacterium]|nr:GNAT family N-acetyltransferase [Gemmatimonadota bacterium]